MLLGFQFCFLGDGSFNYNKLKYSAMPVIGEQAANNVFNSPKITL